MKMLLVNYRPCIISNKIRHHLESESREKLPGMHPFSRKLVDLLGSAAV